MIFVLDTNSLQTASWTLDSPQLQTLIATADKLDNTIVLPRVVVEEVMKHYSTELEDEWKRLNAGVLKYRRMTSSSEVEPIDEQRLQADVAAHRTRIEQLFGGDRARIESHPTVSHGEIVDSYTQGRKPFKSEGAGYKDALIWYTVVELAEAHPDEEVVLVTNNSDDFCASSSPGTQLHPDLMAILDRRSIAPERVTLSKHLFGCVREHVTPRVQAVDETAQLIENGHKIDIGESVEVLINAAFLNDNVEGFSQYEPELFWPYADFWWAQFQEDTSVQTIVGLEVNHISGSKYQVSMSVEFIGSFEVELDLYSDLTDRLDLMPDFDQRSATGTVLTTCQADVSFIWDDSVEDVATGVVENLAFLRFAYPKQEDRMWS